MPAITKKKEQPKQVQLPSDSPEEILRRKRAINAIHGEDQQGGVGGASSPQHEQPVPTGLAAEKPVGALCFLPKSIHRLASRAADDRDITAKRFFLETILIGLEQQGVITPEQHTEALTLPSEYGWKGRK